MAHRSFRRTSSTLQDDHHRLPQLHGRKSVQEKPLAVFSTAPTRKHEPLRTMLSPSEVAMAEEVWAMDAPTGFATTLNQLLGLLGQLQVPQQPIITTLVTERFNEKTHFSFMDFVELLEQCKSIHVRWLHKIRGKVLDDDLLEAFVAVGGSEDSGGAVDLPQMKNVISAFKLNVDLDRIVKELDVDGNATIDFGEFADLLREHQKRSGSAGGGGKRGTSPSVSEEDGAINATYRRQTLGMSGDALDENDSSDKDSEDEDDPSRNVIGGVRSPNKKTFGTPTPVILSSSEYFPVDSDVAVEAGYTLTSPDATPGPKGATFQLGGALNERRRTMALHRGQSQLRLSRQPSSLGRRRSEGGNLDATASSLPPTTHRDSVQATPASHALNAGGRPGSRNETRQGSAGTGKARKGSASRYKTAGRSAEAGPPKKTVASAFYKGSGGLRSLNLNPPSAAAESSQLKFTKGRSAASSPMRGRVRPASTGHRYN